MIVIDNVQTANKIAGMIGLAVRAGQAIIGSEMSLKEIRNDKVSLVILDNSCSENSLKKFSDACEFHNVKLCILPSIGFQSVLKNKGSIVVSLKSNSFRDAIVKIIETQIN